MKTYDLGYVSFAFQIKSADPEWDRDDANLVVHFMKKAYYIPIPNWLIKPKANKVNVTYDVESFIKNTGKDWYYKYNPRVFGFHATPEAFHIQYGEQTMEWPGSKSKCFSYPWELQFKRKTIYSRDEWMTWDDTHYKSSEWNKIYREPFYKLKGDEAWHFDPTGCVFLYTEFVDYDGEVIPVKLSIEELEWHRGKYFPFTLLKYLPGGKYVRKCCGIEFKSEQGRGKGSWKGGIIGTSVDIEDGETLQDAFERWVVTEMKPWTRK